MGREAARCSLREWDDSKELRDKSGGHVNSEVTANDRLVDRIARNTALDPIADALAPAAKRT
jgi:hypothetical protein